MMGETTVPYGGGGVGIVAVKEHPVTGTSYDPAGEVMGVRRDETMEVPEGSAADACAIMTLCNDARIVGVDDGDDGIEDDGDSNKNRGGGGEIREGG